MFWWLGIGREYVFKVFDEGFGVLWYLVLSSVSFFIMFRVYVMGEFYGCFFFEFRFFRFYF